MAPVLFQIISVAFYNSFRKAAHARRKPLRSKVKEHKARMTAISELSILRSRTSAPS